MKTLKQFIIEQQLNEDKPVTPQDLKGIEKWADILFASLGIDVEFTKHFLDRVNRHINDGGEVKPISRTEVARLFKGAYKEHGPKIAKMKPDTEALLTDMETDVNSPFILKPIKDSKGKIDLELVAKTIIRTPKFRPKQGKMPDKKFHIGKRFTSRLDKNRNPNWRKSKDDSSWKKNSSMLNLTRKSKKATKIMTKKRRTFVKP